MKGKKTGEMRRVAEEEKKRQCEMRRVMDKGKTRRCKVGSNIEEKIITDNR